MMTVHGSVCFDSHEVSLLSVNTDLETKPMKKTIAAVAVGILLVAGQAAAQNSGAARVGDRLGATADESSELAGMGMGTIITAAVMAGILILAIEDRSDSD